MTILSTMIIDAVERDGIINTVRSINEALHVVDGKENGVYFCDLVMTPSEYRNHLFQGINYGNEVLKSD